MSLEFTWKYQDRMHCEASAEHGRFSLRIFYNTVGWDWMVYELYSEHGGKEPVLIAKGDCVEDRIAQKMAEAVANLKTEDIRCSHKFVDSANCLHCGWVPPRNCGQFNVTVNVPAGSQVQVGGDVSGDQVMINIGSSDDRD